MKLSEMWGDQRGASALEFGLTAPVFFVFLFGVIEAGLLFWTQIGLQHGAEMAARCATVDLNNCPNQNSITSYAAQQTLGLNLPTGTFVYSPPNQQPCGNQVTASYPFQFPAIFNVAPLTLRAKACFPSP